MSIITIYAWLRIRTNLNVLALFVRILVTIGQKWFQRLVMMVMGKTDMTWLFDRLFDRLHLRVVLSRNFHSSLADIYNTNQNWAWITQWLLSNLIIDYLISYLSNTSPHWFQTRPEKHIMFGCCVAGRLLQTNLQQVDETHAYFELSNASTINHICVFLLGTGKFRYLFYVYNTLTQTSISYFSSLSWRIWSCCTLLLAGEGFPTVRNVSVFIYSALLQLYIYAFCIGSPMKSLPPYSVSEEHLHPPTPTLP